MIPHNSLRQSVLRLFDNFRHIEYVSDNSRRHSRNFVINSEFEYSLSTVLISIRKELNPRWTCDKVSFLPQINILYFRTKFIFLDSSMETVPSYWTQRVFQTSLEVVRWQMEWKTSSGRDMEIRDLALVSMFTSFLSSSEKNRNGFFKTGFFNRFFLF